MKRNILKSFAESLENIMREKDISPKDLAQKSGITYSSLIPIISGSRDFGITKLVSIANALECSTDFLLHDSLTESNNHDAGITRHKSFPQYLAIFISQISATYFMIYDVKSKQQHTSILSYDLGCGQDPNEFLERINNSLYETITKKFSIKPNNKSIAVFAAVQQYEGANNREKIQKIGATLFAKFVLESDVKSNYHALFDTKNGICVTINDGSVIFYSNDHGESFAKIQGYGFPIADTAGNEWIGCEAIKHVINVKEQLEPSTLLSDKILALFNDNIDTIAESAMLNPTSTYKKVSSTVKELVHSVPTAHNIIKKSADLLLQRIKLIDQITKAKLPIALTGDLADTYKDFFPKNRLLIPHQKLSATLLNYGLNLLKKINNIDAHEHPNSTSE